MEINIEIKDGFQIEAKLRDHIIKSDQDQDSGGEDSSPNPFEYFLSSMGLCVSHYINSFCKQRDIDTKNISIKQSITRNPDKKLKIDFNISLPEGFPDKYRESIKKSAASCTVKKAIEDGIDFSLSTS